MAISLIERYRDRRALRGRSALEFVIADGIDYVNPALWDAVTGTAGFFFERTYLRMLEAAGPDNIEPRYALIFRDGAPVAALVMQLVQIDAARVRRISAPETQNAAKRLLKRFVAPATGKLGEGLRQRVLVCGNLLSYGFHAVAFAPDVPPETVWPGVAEVLYRVRRAEKLAGQTGFALLKDLADADVRKSRILERYSYRAVETEPDMVLTLDPKWQSHDAYLAGLNSKYRSAVKNQILKPVTEAGCTLRVLKANEVAGAAERLHALYLAVHENASLRPITLAPDYWAALQTAAGARLRVVVLERSGDMIGFIACLKDGSTGLAYHIGFDRQAAEGLPVYLRLLHAAIAHLIEMGAQRISFGRTALEPKARLGAKPVQLSVWLRHRQPVLNTLVKRLLGLVQHDEAPDTNPFGKKAR